MIIPRQVVDAATQGSKYIKVIGAMAKQHAYIAGQLLLAAHALRGVTR